jgi:hypothetical protein
MEGQRTNSTFGFLPTRKNANSKKSKELLFANAKMRISNLQK